MIQGKKDYKQINPHSVPLDQLQTMILQTLSLKLQIFESEKPIRLSNLIDNPDTVVLV